MALPASGNITLSDIQTETSASDLNAAGIAAGFTAGGTAMTEFYGWSSGYYVLENGVTQVPRTLHTATDPGNASSMNPYVSFTTPGIVIFGVSTAVSAATGWSAIQFEIGANALSAYTQFHIDWRLEHPSNNVTGFYFELNHPDPSDSRFYGHWMLGGPDKSEAKDDHTAGFTLPYSRQTYTGNLHATYKNYDKVGLAMGFQTSGTSSLPLRMHVYNLWFT